MTTETQASQITQKSQDIRVFGSHLTAEGVSYRVWAPVAQRVELEIFEKDQIVRRLPLEPDNDHCFHVLDPAGRAGDLYKFRLNGGDGFPDPASRWQPHGVHGPSMVLDPSAYRWRNTGFVRPAFRDLVIYELHVGTFSPEGTFRSVIERLPYLKKLGVNAIELMPIADFAGERNWGYDGVSLYAPAHAYGHPDDLRALVDEAHGQGLAVILDVVYNHFGPDGNYLAAYIGGYLDEVAKTPWGGAIRYGSPEFFGLRELVIGNVEYWMSDFQIDGFRLDATHAIVDKSERHLLAEVTERIHGRGGYAIAEDSRNEAQLVRGVADGGLGFDALWADDFHHVVRVANTREAEAYLADFKGTQAELIESLEKGWVYSGQHSRFLQQVRGTSADGLRPGACLHCISNHDQVGNRALGERLSDLISADAYRTASALLCLTPHTPMLFMGQEWAASTPFLYFTDHHEELGKLITIGRRNEFKDFAAFKNPRAMASIPDPQDERTFAASRLRWTEREQEPHGGVLALYRACLDLRHRNAFFRPTDRSGWWVRSLADRVIGLGFEAGNGRALLIFDLLGGHRASFDALPYHLSPDQWTCVLSTRETRFGGDGNSALAADFSSLCFDRPEAILLQRVT